MNTKSIAEFKKQFKHEWLLIAVDKMDDSTTTPLSGRLLAHSKDRDEIYKKMIQYKALTLVTYSDDKLPKGYAVAFHV